MWRGASGYTGRGEVAAWIWGIGIRRLVDHLRRRRAPALHVGAAAAILAPAAWDDKADPQRSRIASVP